MVRVAFSTVIPVNRHKSTFCSYSKGKCYPLLRPEKVRYSTVKHFPQGKSGNKNDFYRLIVDNPSHILLLAFLFNGNLALTHRIQQLSL